MTEFTITDDFLKSEIDFEFQFSNPEAFYDYLFNQKWFKAMWWLTIRKPGINSVNLKELLGFGSYSTALTYLQILRRCTIRDKREKLSGRVQVEEFFIGAARAGNRGRRAEGKTIVVVAVER